MTTRILIALLGALAFWATANSAAMVQSDAPSPQVDLGTAIKMYLKALLSIMPCGYEPLDIPVLAPLTIDAISFDTNNTNNRISSNFTDLYVTGLNQLEFIKFNYDNSTDVIDYDINFPQLQLLGEYELKAWALLAGFGAQLNGVGLLNVKFVDYRLVGHFKLAPNSQNCLEATNDVINFYLGDVSINNWNADWDISLNNYFNGFLRDFLLMGAQQIQDEVTTFFNQLVLPIPNEALEQLTSEELVNVLLNVTRQFNAANCQSN